MKACRVRNPFEPVVMTLESQEEVDKLFAVFNFTPISRALNLGGWLEVLNRFKTSAYVQYHARLEGMKEDRDE